MKVVINRCYGGFSLSPRAISELAKLNGKTAYFFTFEPKKKKGQGYDFTPITEKEVGRSWSWAVFDAPDLDFNDNEVWREHSLKSDPDRADPKLVEVVERLGEAANGTYAELAIVEIPDGVAYEIEDYDGRESIHERHRSWS